MVHQRLMRDHGSDLPALLSAWYAAHSGQAVTTEQFRDFLISETNSPEWHALFDQWVYTTPCPTLELAGYGWAAGQVSFELRRVDGADQDLDSIDIVVGSNPPVTTSVSLPHSSDPVQVVLTLPSAPSTIAVDPDGFYILKLTTAQGWLGPEVTLSD
jgi:hypothetical protein